MSYYSQCRQSFTQGQAQRIKDAIATCPVLIYAGGAGQDEVVTTTTWITDKIFDNDLVIRSGVTLTVKAKISMATSRKIIVEGGATLIVEGGTLTVGNNKIACGREDTGPFWKGIEIGSNGSRGFVYFKENAKMEFSYSGLFNTGLAFASGVDSKFHNNRSSVDLLSKGRLGTWVTFTNCEFFITTDYPSQEFYHQIILGNGKADFLNCSINNQTSYRPNFISGIYEIGTALTIKNSPIISGYYYGVRARAFSSTYSIVGNHFENCYVGLYSQSINGFVLSADNEFKVGSYGSQQIGEGFRLAGGARFKIDNNDFLKNSIVTGKGIVIYATSTVDVDYISKDNTFTSLDPGISLPFNLEWLNINPNLYITCNDFINCREDISLHSQTQINILQQFKLQPAGNFFSTMNNNSNYYNPGSRIITYWYNSSNSQENPMRITGVTKVGKTPSYPVRCYQPIIDPTCCPESFHDDHYNSLLNQQTQISLSIDNLLDGGNTTTLYNQVQSATVSNAASLLATISSYSPNVSSKLAKAIWNRYDIFSGEERYGIIMSNPFLMFDTEIIDLVNTPSEGITTAMVNSMNELEIPTSGTRYDLVKQFLEVESEKTVLVKEMTNYHIIGESEQIDLILKWLNRANSPSAIMDAALLCLSNAYYSTLLTYIGQLNTIANSTTSQQLQTEIAQFVSFIDFLTPIYQNGRYEGNLTLTEQNSLLTLSQSSNSWINHVELGILQFYYDLGEPTQPLSAEKGIGTYKNTQELDNVVTTNSFSEIIKNFEVFPNPIKDELVIRQLFIDENSKLKVQLVNLNGKIVLEEINAPNIIGIKVNTSVLPEGLYIVKLFSDGNMLFSTKLIKSY